MCFLVVACTWLAGAVRGQALPDTLRHADWQLLWANEFATPGDSTVLTSGWRFAYPWGRNLGGFEDQYYSGQQVGVDSAGHLRLRAQRRSTPRLYPSGGGGTRALHYESGMVFSTFKRDSVSLPGCPPNREGFSYGLFEIRCRLPRTTATSSAFWLYGHPDEVDIFEAGRPELLSNNMILWSHSYWRPGPLGQDKEETQSFYFWPGPGSVTDAYHTFALSWKPQELTFYFDGIPIRRERRFLPLGCPMDLIANLAMMTWSRARFDSFDIDYIRVYRARQQAVQPPVAPMAPVVGLARQPRTTEAVLNAARSETTWQLLELPGKRPRLALSQNLNPRDFTSLALPSGRHWLPAVVSYSDGETPRHQLVSPDSARTDLTWTLYDLCGRPAHSGHQPPAAAWNLTWPDLAPGSYVLYLRLGTRQVYQKVYHLGRPLSQAFTDEWLLPTPAVTD